MRWILFITGWVAVTLAVIGVFLPVMPTVPFLLLAVACFGRSSERFYTWLLDHAHLGPLIRPYLHGRGISRTSKLKAIVMVWVSIGISVLFLLEALWVRVLLLVIAFGVTLYLLNLPTAGNNDQDDAS